MHFCHGKKTYLVSAVQSGGGIGADSFSTLIPHRFVVFNVIYFIGCFAVKGGSAVKIPVF